MNNYTNENRGEIQKPEYAKQTVLFTGMRYLGDGNELNVTPTDIDGYIELNRNNSLIFFELKYRGDLPYGQRVALQRLVDACQKEGNSVLFVASHNIQTGPIIAKDAVVGKVYWKGRWYVNVNGDSKTLHQWINNYIKWIDEGARCNAKNTKINPPRQP